MVSGAEAPPTTGGTSGVTTSNNNKKFHTRGSKGGNKTSSQSNKNNKFKGAVEKLATIGLKDDLYQTDNFLMFQRGLVQYVLANFDNPGDIVYLPRELKNPMPRLMTEMPTLRKLKIDAGTDPSIADL